MKAFSCMMLVIFSYAVRGTSITWSPNQETRAQAGAHGLIGRMYFCLDCGKILIILHDSVQRLPPVRRTYPLFMIYLPNYRGNGDSTRRLVSYLQKVIFFLWMQVYLYVLCKTYKNNQRFGTRDMLPESTSFIPKIFLKKRLHWKKNC